MKSLPHKISLDAVSRTLHLQHSERPADVHKLVVINFYRPADSGSQLHGHFLRLGGRRDAVEIVAEAVDSVENGVHGARASRRGIFGNTDGVEELVDGTAFGVVWGGWFIGLSASGGEVRCSG